MTDTTLRRHPVRGLIWGVIAGLGAGLLLMVLSIVPLSIPTLIYITVGMAVFGVVWGSVAPAKKPKGPKPTSSTASPMATGTESAAAPAE